MNFNKKIIIIYFCILTASIYADNLSISIKNNLNYMLDTSNEDYSSKIYFNDLKLSAAYNVEYFTAQITLNNKIGNISINDMDTSLLKPLEFDTDDINLMHNRYYPTFLFKIDKSWIEINLTENQTLNFNLEIPFGKNVSAGISYNKLIINEELNIFDKYSLMFNPITTELSGFLDFKIGNFRFGYLNSSITINTENNLKLKDVLEFSFEANSNYYHKTFIEYNKNKLNIILKGETRKYTFGEENPIYALNNNSLFAGNDEGSSLSYFKLSGLTKYKNLSLNLLHTTYSIDPIDLFFNSSPFIYGTIAYRNFNILLPKINLYDSKIIIGNTFKSNFGTTNFNLGYRRLYTNEIIVRSSYKEFIGILFLPKLVYKSEIKEDVIKYNHLNIVDIKLNHEIKIFSNFIILTEISQLVPFFDLKESINNLKQNTITIDTEEYLRGGLKLSLELKLLL